MARHAAESFDLIDVLNDENQGLPTRKSRDEFECECGMVFPVTLSPADEAYHRSHYHGYCGQCKCEPCICY